MVKAIFIPAGNGNISHIADCIEVEAEVSRSDHCLFLYYNGKQYAFYAKSLEEDFEIWGLNHTNIESEFAERQPNKVVEILSGKDWYRGDALLVLRSGPAIVSCSGGLFFMLLNHLSPRKRIFYDEQYYKNEVYKFNELLDKKRYDDVSLPANKKQRVTA